MMNFETCCPYTVLLDFNQLVLPLPTNRLPPLLPHSPSRSEALARKPSFEKESLPNKICSPEQGCGMVSISNDRLKVGVDMQRGGAISWLSSPKMPGALADANLINTWDSGRLIQQSYYGCYDDTCWVDKPW
jgi:hypothetical protein